MTQSKDESSMSDTPSLQHVVQVQLVTALDDVVDIYEGISDTVAQGIISDTLNAVQERFYLVPKSQVLTNGDLVLRDPPAGAVIELVSDLWNNVSN